jgi:drug/metabolite transporter (DMT)-like permease
MKIIPRLTALLTLFAMLASASVACADDNVFRETFRDAFYGGAVGTLVGAALLVFTKKPADHLDFMAYGAAAGVLAGAAYGVAKSTRSLATIENGNIRIAMPMIIPDLVESPSSRQTVICWRADLIRGTFN